MKYTWSVGPQGVETSTLICRVIQELNHPLFGFELFRGVLEFMQVPLASGKDDV